jgi:predicted nucleic acid-binding protein
MKVFIDTGIPMYAAGKGHPLKAGCLDVLRAAAGRELNAYTDTEVLQEILYRYFSINKRGVGLQVFDAFARIMRGAVLPVRPEDILLVRRLAEETFATALSPRDLIHLAVMQNNSIRRIITTDRAFEKVEGIQVIHP